MVNFNGAILEKESLYLNIENRGLRYGDALFETLRMVNNEVILWEEHYLRLMASMRILRMDIPMEFTMEYLETQIKNVALSAGLKQSRIRITVYRNNGGLYTPEDNTISFIIEATPLSSPFFILSEKAYEAELFKDFKINADMLSNLKTNNRILNVVGSVFAKENDYDTCFLLNNEKQVVEALHGNIFIVKGNTIKTPPLSDGCIQGIIREQLLKIIGKLDAFVLEESSISPFELQKADEIFLTNSILGIQPITKYRKKSFGNTTAKSLLGKLNAVIRLQKHV